MPEHRDLFSLAKGLRRADQARRKLTRDCVGAVLVSAADQAIERIPQKGIGRKIWGQKNTGLKKLVRVGKVDEVGDNMQGTVTAAGLAGLIEEGGRTEEHDIKPRRGGRLLARRAGENHGRVFFVKAGRFVGPIQRKKRRPKGTVVIQHPGGPVEKQGRVLEALEELRPTFTHALEEMLDRSMSEVANG